MKSSCPNCHIPLDPHGRCARCNHPGFTSRFSSVMLMIVGLLCLNGLLGTLLYAKVGPYLEEANISLRAGAQSFPYAVATPPPPADRTKPVRFGLTRDKRNYLKTLFEDRDFARLNQELQQLQDTFEQDSSTEKCVRDAYYLFDDMHDHESLLSEWLSQYPRHFAPHLARGRFYFSKGWESRGGKYAKDTSEKQFEEMRRYYALAQSDLRHALQLNPRLLPAYNALISMYAAQSQDDEEQTTIARAVKLFPDSTLLHLGIQNYKLPQWGGSYFEMERFARQAIRQADVNPELYQLFGMIYEHQAYRFLDEKDYAKAIEYLQKALSYGETANLYMTLGRLYQDQTRYKDAVVAYDHAIELDDANSAAFRKRATCHFHAGAKDKALADIRTVRELDPNDPYVANWCRWAIPLLTADVTDEYRNELLALAGLTAPPGSTSAKAQSQNRLTWAATAAVAEQKPATDLKITKMFNAPAGAQPSGLEWHRQRLYLSSYKVSPGIYQLDPANGAVLRYAKPQIVSDNRYGGLATDGGVLYQVQANNGVDATKLSLDTLTVRERFTFNCAQNKLSDLAYVDHGFFAIAPDSTSATARYGLMRFSALGEVQQVFQMPFAAGTVPNFGLASDGRWLWVSAGKQLVKIDPATGNVLADYALPLNRIESLAWDGEKLWAAAFNGEIFTIVTK